MQPRLEQIAELRHRLASLEGRRPSPVQLAQAPATAAQRQGPASLAPQEQSSSAKRRFVFGVQKLDELFANGGMPIGSLHEFYAPQTRNSGAVSGFVSALVGQLMRERSGKVLWIVDDTVLRETGGPYGPGLSYYGVEPSRLVLVTPKREDDVLWAMEEGAHCSDLVAVVGELQGEMKGEGLTVTRRLVLRAERSGTPVFLVGHGWQAAPSAALTRWQVLPRVSGGLTEKKRKASAFASGGKPQVEAAQWSLLLERNREGRPGRCDLEWNHDTNSFCYAPENTVPVVQGAGNGPDLPKGSGQVVALRGSRWAAGRLRQTQERTASDLRE
ncbi:inducible mutagenesis protein A [Rhodobacteraceae bacterium RKSG542]|uniref:ImuA family protein n=1 Tax=Pseudovibrio flavus TaxID=2529854 RepID=UPI0012BD82AE|nr:inducible mutagenesis protein A [Pseudovibrio flavus]MTI18329.1 inducible mutagenesis protein A [Pseudovibrio flavus]